MSLVRRLMNLEQNDEGYTLPFRTLYHRILGRLVSSVCDNIRCRNDTYSDPPTVCKFSYSRLGGNLLAVGNDSGIVRFYNTSLLGNVKELSSFQAYNQHITDLQYSFDDESILLCPGSILGTDEERHCPKIFHTATGTLTTTLIPSAKAERGSNQHTSLPGSSPVTSLCYLPGSPYLISTVSSDGTLSLYDIRSHGNSTVRCSTSTTSNNPADESSGSRVRPELVTAVPIATDTSLSSSFSTHPSTLTTSTVPRIAPYAALCRAHVMDTSGSLVSSLSSFTNFTRKSYRLSTSTAPCISSVQAIDNYLITGGSYDGIVRFWDIRKLPSLASFSSSSLRSTSKSSSIDASIHSKRKTVVNGNLLRYHVAFDNTYDTSGAVYSISQPHIVPTSSGTLSSSLSSTSTPQDADEDDNYSPSSFTPTSSSNLRYYGISSMDVSPDIKYGCPLYGTSSLNSCSLLVAYKSSRIVVYNLSQILNGGSSYYNSLGQAEQSCDRLIRSCTADVTRSNHGSVLGKRSHSVSSASSSVSATHHASDTTINRPTGNAAFVTPPRTTVRASRAWDYVHRITTDNILEERTHSSSSPIGKQSRYTEYGGHRNNLLFIYARFSRCGQFISSGSTDSRGYIWDLNCSTNRNDTESDTETMDDDRDRINYPIYVFGNQGSTVSSVEWGGTPLTTASLASSSSIPDHNLRIATLTDYGYVRIWGPCPSEDPDYWFNQNERGTHDNSNVSSSTSPLSSAYLASSTSQLWRIPSDKDIVGTIPLSSSSGTVTTDKTLSFSTAAYDFTVNDDPEQWVGKGSPFRYTSKLNSSLPDSIIQFGAHEGCELDCWGFKIVYEWSIPYSLFIHPSVIRFTESMHKFIEENLSPDSLESVFTVVGDPLSIERIHKPVGILVSSSGSSIASSFQSPSESCNGMKSGIVVDYNNFVTPPKTSSSSSSFLSSSPSSSSLTKPVSDTVPAESFFSNVSLPILHRSSITRSSLCDNSNVASDDDLHSTYASSRLLTKKLVYVPEDSEAIVSSNRNPFLQTLPTRRSV